MLLPGGRAVLFGMNEGGDERVAVLDSTGEQKVLVEGGENPCTPPRGISFSPAAPR